MAAARNALRLQGIPCARHKARAGLFSAAGIAAAASEELAEKVQESGKEYITIYYGADMDEAQAQQAADIFAEICPDADINLLSGGQPVYYYLISAE